MEDSKLLAEYATFNICFVLCRTSIDYLFFVFAFRQK